MTDSPHTPGPATPDPRTITHRTYDAVHSTFDSHAMSVIYGEPGIGRTLLVHKALNTVAGHRVVDLTGHCSPRATLRSLRHALLDQLPPLPRPYTSSRVDPLIIRHLTVAPHMIVCEEPGAYSGAGLKYLRWLWDCGHGHRPAVLLLSGPRIPQELQDSPHLRARIWSWYRIPPLPPGQTPLLLAGLHPLWRDVDPQLITYADAHGLAGRLGLWQRFTSHLVTATEVFQTTAVTRRLIDWALARTLTFPAAGLV